MRALSIAATGMAAQEMQLEVVANNIANTNTTGFKRARAEFTDLIYHVERARGVSASSQSGGAPEGVHLGLGVRTAAIRQVQLQGAMQETGNRLDVALDGSGFFAVEGRDGQTLFTRAGAFNTNAEGQIVTLDGLRLADAIVVPDNGADLRIAEDGAVSVRLPGEAQRQIIGAITLRGFVNPAGLEPVGENLFRLSSTSGEAVAGVPGEGGFGRLRQGYLEASNVDAIREIADMISAQRAYEMNAKVVQAADDMAATVSKGIR
jgi:flagellar basal-body rod protein FlgG